MWAGLLDIEHFADWCLPEPGKCRKGQKEFLSPQQQPNTVLRNVRDFRSRNVVAKRYGCHQRVPRPVSEQPESDAHSSRNSAPARCPAQPRTLPLLPGCERGRASAALPARRSRTESPTREKWLDSTAISTIGHLRTCTRTHPQPITRPCRNEAENAAKRR